MANHYIAFSIFIMAVHLYINHKQNNYTGSYNNKGNYEYISPMKHDIFKQITISLFILSVYGYSVNEVFFDSNDILNSFIGKLFISVISYLIYYQLIEPYVVNKIINF
jgi:cytosine/uracil/thiamine/allantoin permease